MAGWCMLVLAAMAWGQVRPAAPRYASIAGLVLEDGTGAPVPRAIVTLRTKSAESADAVAWTDDRGTFSFSRVPLGQYYLMAGREGYEMASLGAARYGQPPEVLSLPTPQDRRVTLRMRLVGSISGVVTDADGDPIAGVNVTVLVSGFNRRKAQFGGRGAAQADSRGRYRIGGLPAGTYILMEDPQVQRPSAPAEAVRGQAQEELRYARQFYPNGDRASVATPVQLAAGKNLEGFDFQLSAQPSTRVSGKIILPADVPPATPVTLMLREEGEIGQGFFRGGAANPGDGGFEWNDILPGSYMLVASVAVQGRQYRGTERVEVGRVPVQVTVRMDPGVDLAGSVRLEGDPGKERPHFRVTLFAGDELPAYGLQPQADVAPDGTFVIPGVAPGIWDIGVDPVPAGGYIKSMRLGEQDVLREEMFVGSATSARLNIVVSTRGAVVDGSVTRPEGEIATNAFVLLAPSGAHESVSSFYRVTLAGEDGHFEMKGLTPGAYTIYALDRMDTDPAQDPGFLKALSGRGETIELAEGAHVTRELKLMPEAVTK